MPQTHQSECKKISKDRGCVHAPKPFAARSGKQEPHVDVIAKPKRKRDVPAVPEIANVSRKERLAEVFRSMYPKEITKADSKSAVPGEIEEQVETVRIHVTEQRTETPTARCRFKPLLFDQRRDYKLVK